jgi:cobalamin biosynthesis protein CobD/CbiB
MKTDNNQQERIIEELLREIPLEKYSISFTDNLLSVIEKEVIREKKKRNVRQFMQIAAGVIAILSVPVLTYFLAPILLKEVSFSLTIPKIHFNPFILTTGFAILFLLIADTLIRKHIQHKKDH